MQRALLLCALVFLARPAHGGPVSDGDAGTKFTVSDPVTPDTGLLEYRYAVENPSALGPADELVLWSIAFFDDAAASVVKAAAEDSRLAAHVKQVLGER